MRISGGFQIITNRAALNLIFNRKNFTFIFSFFIHIFLNVLSSTNFFSLGCS